MPQQVQQRPQFPPQQQMNNHPQGPNFPQRGPGPRQQGPHVRPPQPLLQRPAANQRPQMNRAAGPRGPQQGNLRPRIPQQNIRKQVNMMHFVQYFFLKKEPTQNFLFNFIHYDMKMLFKVRNKC